jgi:hypothetical protein
MKIAVKIMELKQGWKNISAGGLNTILGKLYGPRIFIDVNL